MVNLDKIAKEYIVEEDYDKINTLLGHTVIQKYLGKNKTVLEVGSADGVMTNLLHKECKVLDVVEPSCVYADKISMIDGVRHIYNCFLEDIDEPIQYDVVLLMGLLHHIEKPEEFLDTVKKFITPNGIVLATVPNVNSIHRQIGVEMGLLNDVKSSSQRNISFQQFGRFTKDTFLKLFKKSNYEVADNYGYMFKPFSSEMMMKLDLTDAQVNALFAIGRKYQDMCSQLFVAAKPND